MACRSMGSFFSRNFQSSGATPHRFSVGPNHHRPPFTDPTPPLTETHAPRSRGPHTSRGGGAGLRSNRHLVSRGTRSAGPNL
ncbi:hypothetical protein BHE74_00001947 [Ensete ventricosum]|nr:hypothetical protein BHE74_00001947 [Ensete ventricosum]